MGDSDVREKIVEILYKEQCPLGESWESLDKSYKEWWDVYFRELTPQLLALTQQEIRDKDDKIHILQKQLDDALPKLRERCVLSDCRKTIYIHENAYRCFYCGQWFCKYHAKQHFHEEHSKEIQAERERIFKELEKYKYDSDSPFQITMTRGYIVILPETWQSLKDKGEVS